MAMTVESDGNDKAKKKKLGWSFWLKRTDGYHEKTRIGKDTFFIRFDTYQRGKKIFAVLYPDLHTSESFQAIGSLRNLQVSRFAYSFLTSRSVNLKSR